MKELMLGNKALASEHRGDGGDREVQGYLQRVGSE